MDYGHQSYIHLQFRQKRSYDEQLLGKILSILYCWYLVTNICFWQTNRMYVLLQGENGLMLNTGDRVIAPPLRTSLPLVDMPHRLFSNKSWTVIQVTMPFLRYLEGVRIVLSICVLCCSSPVVTFPRIGHSVTLLWTRKLKLLQ